MREGHLHTIEIVLVAGVTTAVVFHAFRFFGAKLASTSPDGPFAKVGRGVLGVFTFDRGGL